MPPALRPKFSTPPVVQHPYSFDRTSFNRSLQKDAEFYGHQPHSFARCPPPKLLSLLTWTPPDNPHLTKAGTKRVNKAKRHVDESAEFYTAQLLHYGLKPLKTRAPAKAALLKAFEARLSSFVLLAL
ncbi:hypothetical protein BDY24DRAFT_414520 [Mrakia frigida]|uniref:uncharacterized protein n=1 Tax=Mrakia frigida TaxID=29902 RepID=UPI003FCC1CB1